jgi:hypothetical protein
MRDRLFAIKKPRNARLFCVANKKAKKLWRTHSVRHSFFMVINYL